MSVLAKLRDPAHRDAIFLAELAGLLHNIGKLDPNFLSSKASNETVAAQEVKNHWFDIPNYYFDRFAAPDLGLLKNAIQTIVANANWPSRLEAAKDLQTQFTDSAQKAAVDGLIKDWDQAKNSHPLIAKQLEAARQLYAFRIPPHSR